MKPMTSAVACVLGAVLLAGCTQEQQNKISRDIQNWTGTNGVLEIYAGDKLARRGGWRYGSFCGTVFLCQQGPRGGTHEPG
jgi:hypothetical protein